MNRILRAFLPVRCVLCSAPTDGAALCRGCHDDLPWLPAGAFALPKCPPVRAALAYQYPVDRLIAAAKFHSRIAHARMLGELLAEYLRKGQGAGDAPWVTPDALVPVPLHRARLATRGYNQALELARPLAEQLRVPLRPALLRRRRATAEQSGLTAEERRRNVAGSFEAASVVLQGMRIALVDDVVTTGNTAAAAAAALMRASARDCVVWAVALARPERDVHLSRLRPPQPP